MWRAPACCARRSSLAYSALSYDAELADTYLLQYASRTFVNLEQQRGGHEEGLQTAAKQCRLVLDCGTRG